MTSTVFVLILSLLFVLHVSAANKKGLAMSLRNCEDIDFVNADWWWNWQPDDWGCKSNAEFVPNIWGTKYLKDLDNLPSGTTWLMGFNEPNFALGGIQELISPQAAAQHWPKFEATGKKLIAPTPALYGSGGQPDYFEWMDSFLSRCGSDCRIDAVGFHYYSSTGDADHIMKIIDKIYAKYKKPIWVTEICMNKGSEESNLRLMKSLLPLFESHPGVGRYSWVANRWTFDDVARKAALLPVDTSKMELTGPGNFFKNFKSSASPFSRVTNVNKPKPKPQSKPKSKPQSKPESKPKPKKSGSGKKSSKKMMILANGKGLKRKYFDGTNFQSYRMEDVGDIDFHFDGNPVYAKGTTMASTTFSMKVTGTVLIPETGDYNFLIASDDGIKLWVDGDLQVNHWDTHARAEDKTKTFSLKAGDRLPIRVEYFQQQGEAQLVLKWKTPSTDGKYVIIPTKYLYI